MLAILEEVKTDPELELYINNFIYFLEIRLNISEFEMLLLFLFFGITLEIV